MKAVAYSIKPFEKEYLAKANQKNHDITLISNPLGPDTVVYAKGKEAVIVFTNDDVSADVVEKLSDLGVRYIVTRSVGTDHIDKNAAALRGIKIANVPSYSSQAIAEHSVTLAFALNRHVVQAYQHSHIFDFRNDDLIGFTFSGKTVGIIGLGSTGQAVAAIYNGCGCNVIGYDIDPSRGLRHIKMVSLETLLSISDIITLHAPLTADTRQMIQKDTLDQMKNGVMLINTSSGMLLNTADVLAAIEAKKVGYLGLDVYEFDHDLFFENHQHDLVKDLLLERLIGKPNVLITPHQGFLTSEALQHIADRTIQTLNQWQQNKCAGNACACAKNCKKTGVLEKKAILKPWIKPITNLSKNIT